jgi:DNA-binding MurR/RpiR family transcriptional regulator
MARNPILKNSATRPIAIEVLDEISQRMDDFTPQQRVFAEFVLKNPESLAFYSITDLARKAGVSQATIVRFCNVLGYDGYAQLSREAQQAIQVELGTVGRFQLVRQMRSESTEDIPASEFERIVSFEIENLVNLSKSVETSEFYECIKLLAKADRVSIVGCLGSTSLAMYFGYTLSKILPQVDIIHGHGVMTSAILHRLTPKSLVFLISFPRYPRETLEIGRIAAEKRAKIIAITNSHICPVMPLASLAFILPVGLPSYVDAYASPIVFINALITELSHTIPEGAQQALSNFDDYALQTDLFLKSRLKDTQPQKVSAIRSLTQSKS